MKQLLFLIFLFVGFSVSAQTTRYPFPVYYLGLTIEQQKVKVAYMDVKPDQPNGETVMLFHGKNFNGYYWKEVIGFLSQAGYRVIVPDQLGFGYSDKPAVSYSFHLLATNTKKILDTLGIRKIHLIAHSMGGMLATRFVLMFPQTVDKLIYENPIGLEDYKTFIPYRTFDQQYAQELKADLNSLRKYQQGYYPQWKPEYEQYVLSQWEAVNRPSLKAGAWASAGTYMMIYEQPVIYEMEKIQAQTLLLIGQADRTVVGKNLLDSTEAAKHGNYPMLGKWLQGTLKNSTLVELPEVGHIPHIQSPAMFKQQVINFLAAPGLKP